MPAPLFDQSGTSQSSGGTTTTISVSTGGTNKLVLVACTAGGTSTTANPALTISGASLTWTAVDAAGAGAGFGPDFPQRTTCQIWWAIAATQLTNQTITITSNQTIDDWATVRASFTDAYLAQPIDANAAAKFASFNTTPNVATLSSNNSDNIAVVVIGTNHSISSPPLARTGGLIHINHAYNPAGTRWALMQMGYAAYSAPQTSVQPGFSTSLTSMGVIGVMITAESSPPALRPRRRSQNVIRFFTPPPPIVITAAVGAAAGTSTATSTIISKSDGAASGTATVVGVSSIVVADGTAGGTATVAAAAGSITVAGTAGGIATVTAAGRGVRMTTGTATGTARALTPADPNFSKVVLLVGADGVNGATTILDESRVARPLTAVGTAQISTAQFKFGVSSLLLSGSGAALSAADSVDWTFGTGTFTVEGFFRFSAFTTAPGLVTQWNSSGTTGWAFWFPATNSLGFRAVDTGGSTRDATGFTFTPTLNQWYHLAVDRDAGNVLRIYRDGVMVAKTAVYNFNLRDSDQPLDIGRVRGFSLDMNGYVDEIRVTKGAARYASDAGFTVPTAAYPRG